MQQPLLSFQSLLPEEAAALVAAVRRIVPHQQPELQEAAIDTAQSIDGQLVGDSEHRALVRSGVTDLDQRARSRGGTAFVELDPAEQDAVLAEIEGSIFFQRLINATVSDFYNRHVVWEALGYPGLAQKRDGRGYLDAGFDELGW